MRWDKTISTHELKGLLFRGGGIVVSALSGLAALKAFLVLNQREAAVLIGLVGYLAFMPLAQFGFGKPCYGEVRERFVGHTLQTELIRSFLRMFAWQSALAAFLFAGLATVFARTQGYSHGLMPVFFFALGQGALGGSTYQRDLSYALSCDPYYENWEFLRRCTVLLSYLAILMGLPIWFGGLLCLAAALVSQFKIARRLESVPALASSGLPGETWRDLLPKLGIDARRYFVFSLNEQLFYNVPLLVFSVLSMQAGIIYFGIWTKLFFLIVLPMRMVVDARVNRQTGLYFQGDRSTVWSSLKHSAMLALVIIALGMVGMLIVKPLLLMWVGAAAMTVDPWLLASLFVWGAGNAIQHVFGTFTISYRNGFGFALRASLISLALVGGVFTSCVLMGFSPGHALVVAGVTYFLCAWIYLHHVWKLMQAPSSTLEVAVEDHPS